MLSAAKTRTWTAIGCALALAGCGAKPKIPSDAQLIATYQANREALNGVVAEMGRGLDEVTLKGAKAVPEPKDADPARVARVAQVLRKVGARSVEAGETGPEAASRTAVRIAVLVPGAWGSKSIKGLVYDPAADPQDQVPDTDAFARRGEKARFIYVERRIDRDWYIYQWVD